MYVVRMAFRFSIFAKVGNELGACEPEKVRIATLVALGCAVLRSLIKYSLDYIYLNIYLNQISKDKWAIVFTNDESVMAIKTTFMPIMCLYELGNYP
eukprot:Gb_03265 [translate_table: standard]